jgi:hypothetical protein
MKKLLAGLVNFEHKTWSIIVHRWDGMDLVSRADDGMGHSASFAHDHPEAFPLPNLPEEKFLVILCACI